MIKKIVPLLYFCFILSFASADSLVDSYDSELSFIRKQYYSIQKIIEKSESVHLVYVPDPCPDPSYIRNFDGYTIDGETIKIKESGADTGIDGEISSWQYEYFYSKGELLFIFIMERESTIDKTLDGNNDEDEIIEQRIYIFKNKIVQALIRSGKAKKINSIPNKKHDEFLDDAGQKAALLTEGENVLKLYVSLR